MKKTNIVFYGTPAFAVATLKMLYEANYNIVAVVTAADKPSGRGRKLHMSPVKIFALKYQLPLLQPENLKDPHFISTLKSYNPELQIVVAFRMLPEVIWRIPKWGTFNLHASLLPQYRGAAPINWAIMNGESKTGATTFLIDDKIDTGEILLQEEVAIDKNDDAGTLHDKLMLLGSQLVLKTVEYLGSKNYRTVLQHNHSDLKTAPKLNHENTKIEWHQSLTEIYNKINGLCPLPGAWSYLSNNNETFKVKIYKSQPLYQPHEYAIGTILATKNTLLIAVDKGFLSILEIQLPGKKRMDITSLLNGYVFNNQAKVS